MDLYEYQARELLEQEDIPTPQAVYVYHLDEVAQAVAAVGLPCVVKAQVKIGHRGQAGGVKLAHTVEEAEAAAAQILPMSIHGHRVHGLLIASAVNIIHEYYVSISVDRSSRDYDVLATANGGTEVEEVARQHPESVKRLHINPLEDFDIDAARSMAEEIGFYHADGEQAAQILLKMWNVFKSNDATLVEINPLAKIGDPDDDSSKTLCALDAKISLDNNASFRHPEWEHFTSATVEDKYEQRAAQHGLHYVHLAGEVGVIGNGAGLVMSSLDAVHDAGLLSTNELIHECQSLLSSEHITTITEQSTQWKHYTPANFLDIGGGASAEVMAESLSIVLSDTQVQSVLVNVYGGLTSCKLVAEGILQAVDKLQLTKPIIVRFSGNEADEGLSILRDAHSPFVHVAPTMETAAACAVAFAHIAS